MYLGFERGDGNEHRHKLAAAAAGFYPVLVVEGKHLLLEREDTTVYCFSRDHVIYAPILRTKNELQRAVRPMIVEELTLSAYPTSKQSNTRSLPPAELLLNPNTSGHITKWRAHAIQKAQMANTKSSVTTNLSSRDAQAETPQEYATDQISNHGISNDKKHPSA